MTEYEKDLNELKEQILKEGDTLVSKRALLERFCEMDKEYNGKSWNLLQILANIDVLIGEESKIDVLNKIKAEIEDLDIFYDNDYFSSNHDAMFKCSEVLQIIDKYKEMESEE